MGRFGEEARKSVEGSYGWVRERAEARLSSALGPGYWVWIKDVFPDELIAEIEPETYDFSAFEEIPPAKLLRFPYSVEGGELVLGEPEEVRMDYVAKARREARKWREAAGPVLTGPIVLKDEENRLAYAAVLVPGEPDLNGEPPLSKEEVRKYAHGYMKNFRFMDVNHDFNISEKDVPVESWCIPDGMEMSVKAGGEDAVLPEGTWIIGGEISEENWPRVKSGELAGWSITGLPAAELGVAQKAQGGVKASLKNLLLKDLENPVVGIVSMVSAPAVPKAKWFALKGRGSVSREDFEAWVEENRLDKASKDEGGGRAEGLGEKLGRWLRGGADAPLVEAASKNGEEEVGGVSKEEVQEIIREEFAGLNVNAAVKAALEENGLIEKPKTDAERIAELEETVRKLQEGSAAKGEAEAGDEGSGETEDDAAGDEPDAGDELTDLLAQLSEDEVRAVVKAARARKGARRSGGRGAAKKSAAEPVEVVEDARGGVERDGYGRSIKKRYTTV